MIATIGCETTASRLILATLVKCSTGDLLYDQLLLPISENSHGVVFKMAHDEESEFDSVPLPLLLPETFTGHNGFWQKKTRAFWVENRHQKYHGIRVRKFLTLASRNAPASSNSNPV